MPHLLVQQATSVLLAAVAALSLGNVAGGHTGSPAAMADLLRSAELKEQLDKREWWTCAAHVIYVSYDRYHS